MLNSHSDNSEDFNIHTKAVVHSDIKFLIKKTKFEPEVSKVRCFSSLYTSYKNTYWF